MTNVPFAWASELLTNLKERGVLDEATVLVIGSAARNARTPRSDIDVLVITPQELQSWPTPPEIQLILMTRARFLERLRQRDDFPHWVARFGIVLIDEPGWWKRVLRHPALHEWPDWRCKQEQAAKRLSIASRLYSSGDYEHAEEEYLLSAAHLARALSLEARVFPLSRPELPGQLRELGYADLADALDSLIRDSLPPADLMRIEHLLTGYLTRLSKKKSGAARRQRARIRK